MELIRDNPGDPLVRRVERLVNARDATLVVWLEPWGEEHSVPSGESLDVVLVGPEGGVPEIAPGLDGVSVYAWEDCRAFALANGRLAVPQPTVADIVAQEFEIAGDRIRWTDESLPADDIEMVQRILDMDAEANEGSQLTACELAMRLTGELSDSIQPSSDAVDVLWQIADRVMGTRGALLAPLSALSKKLLWTDSANLNDFIREHAYSFLPGRFKLFGESIPAPPDKSRNPAKRPRGERRSD